MTVPGAVSFVERLNRLIQRIRIARSLDENIHVRFETLLAWHRKIDRSAVAAHERRNDCWQSVVLPAQIDCYGRLIAVGWTCDLANLVDQGVGSGIGLRRHVDGSVRKIKR